MRGLITTPSARMFSSSCFSSSSRSGGILPSNSGSMVRCGDIGSYLSMGGVSVSRSRLDVIVETIAGLAVSTDIFGLLVNVCPAQECFPGVLKRVQTDLTQGHKRCRIDFVYIVTAHKIVLLLWVCKKPTVWGSVPLGGGLKSGLGPSPICPRRPGEGWEPSGGGFAPLHRPFGRPAFFVAGPRVTEVSLSGSTRRLNYSVFKVLRRSLIKAYQKFFRSRSDS